MAVGSARLREGKKLASIGLALVGMGIGLLWVWRPAAVAVAFLGAFVAFNGGGKANVPATRLAGNVATLVYGVTLGIASGSPLLGAAAGVPFFLFTMLAAPTERMGYKAGRLLPAFAAIGLALFAAAYPWGWWALGAAPALLLVSFMSLGFQKGLSELARSGPARWPAGVGDPAPPFNAPTRDGGSFDLADERGRWVLLCFLRGDWCAMCQIMMRSFKKYVPVLAARNVKLVAISPTGGPEAQEFARELELDYTIVADTDLAVTRAFGAVQPKGAMDGSDSPLPVAFLVDPQGVIRAASRADDPTTYHHPLDVLAVVP